jgi:hypothetical protein
MSNLGRLSTAELPVLVSEGRNALKGGVFCCGALVGGVFCTFVRSDPVVVESLGAASG